MEHLAELLQQHLTGPSWKVTRDVLAEQPGVLPELCSSMEHELRLLVDQIENRETKIDLRITTEHLILVLGRLMPVISAVVADLYMMRVMDNDSADEAPPTELDTRGERLHRLLEQLNQHVTTAEAQQVAAILARIIRPPCLGVLREGKDGERH